MYAVMRITCSLLFLIALNVTALAQDSVAAKTPLAVQLPGTSITLSPGMSFEQVRAQLPDVEITKTLGMFGYEIHTAPIPYEGDDLLFMLALDKKRLSMFSLSAGTDDSSRVVDLLRGWFHAQVDSLPASAYRMKTSNRDSLESWTTPQIKWSRERSMDKETKRWSLIYMIEFLKEKE